MPRGRPKKQIPIEVPKRKRGRPRKVVPLIEVPNRNLKKKRGRPRKVMPIVNPPLIMEEPVQKPRKVFRKPRKSRKKSFIPMDLRKADPNATLEEEVIRRERLSEILPKYDPYKPKNIIDLVSDAKECANITKDSCFRPDIYLDYGCWDCKLFKHCVCRIKMVKKPKK